MSWTPNQNFGNTLAGYKVYLNGFLHETIPLYEGEAYISNLVSSFIYDMWVTAYDHFGNESDFTVKKISIDKLKVENIVVDSGFNDLYISWDEFDNSAGSLGEIAGYSVYVEGELYERLPFNQTYTFVDLLASGYVRFAIVAYDVFGNESDFVQMDAYGLVPNPADVTVTDNATSIDVAWVLSYDPQIIPLESNIIKYDIYVQASDFTDVSFLTPAVSVFRDELVENKLTIDNIPSSPFLYVGVVAVNYDFQFHPFVTPVFIDRSLPVGCVENLDAALDGELLNITWNPPGVNFSNLAGYKLYINDELIEGSIPADTREHIVSSVDDQTIYKIQLIPYDLLDIEGDKSTLIFKGIPYGLSCKNEPVYWVGGLSGDW